MTRRGSVTAALLMVVALGATGCGAAQTGRESAPETGVEVVAAMGAEGLALAALGLDPAELDPEPAAVDPAAAATSTAASGEASAEGKTRRERAEEWRKRRTARVLLRDNRLHGEAVVRTKDGGTKTVAAQRGEVTALDGDRITVRSTDGFTQTWTFGEELRVIERRRTIRSTDIAVGTKVGVAGAKTGDTATARLIVIPAKQD
ncbi:hypothetical protein [Micromonospora endophytica]|uniref:Uncharacterized protein n=1 Tax=Micromonospora endophytica TaxID=515350 RepID=A0A2W2BLG5_9ACTN|nr:hypothetical protein [Micromonospora endophytica]PZF86852.1 hypothetical protein C1I93_27345 [Micromonospora endophytica]RIW45224.1 hypothetical protein D3H59_15680 [Micromonospora endophytica]BCJ59558.1 hypothetical protein Jiend_29800 [Micromonospora endophytica]